MEVVRSLGLALIALCTMAPLTVNGQNSVLSLAEAADLFSRTSYILDMKISPDGKHLPAAIRKENLVNISGKLQQQKVRLEQQLELALSGSLQALQGRASPR